MKLRWRRTRSISYYAVEQKESCSIRGAASHIRQGVNDQKPAPEHQRPAFLIRSPLFFKLKSAVIPALREVHARSISYYAVGILSKKKLTYPRRCQPHLAGGE